MALRNYKQVCTCSIIWFVLKVCNIHAFCFSLDLRCSCRIKTFIYSRQISGKSSNSHRCSTSSKVYPLIVRYLPVPPPSLPPPPPPHLPPSLPPPPPHTHTCLGMHRFVNEQHREAYGAFYQNFTGRTLGKTLITSSRC